MIHLKAHVHDSTTLEFKINYETKEHLPKADFELSMWLFIPENLESNEQSFSRDIFYENIKSRMRLISPRYKLDSLVTIDAFPYEQLRRKMKQLTQLQNKKATKELRHDVCMVCNIVRSSVREISYEIENCSLEKKVFCLTNNLVKGVGCILNNYRICGSDLPSVIKKANIIYKLGDEYLCQMFQSSLYYLTDCFKDKGRVIPSSLQFFLKKLQEDMKNRGYLFPSRTKEEHNNEYIQRSAWLKKFIESDLYLVTRQQKNGYLLEQLMFMFTAGMAMVFALIVSFYTRNMANHYSLPLIVLMVVSYMFKDRIKDWMRYWFQDKAGKVFFDHRTRLQMNDVIIGSSKQGIEYKTSEEIPEFVKAVRHQHKLHEELGFVKEDILQYRRSLKLNYKRISHLSCHPLLGAVEIFRLNLNLLMRWMDNPIITVHSSDENGDVINFEAKRVYFIDIVVQSLFLEHEEYNLYRVELNKSGICSIEHL